MKTQSTINIRSFFNLRLMRIYLMGVVVLGLSCANELRAQQEQMYSQYMFNMLNINPAYAGFRGANNLTMLYRAQWVGVQGAPRTAVIDWDARAENSNIGYGLGIYNDQLGIEKTIGIQSFYSYYLPFSDSYLALGVSAGVLNYQADYWKATVINPNDPVSQENVNTWLPSAGFGALYSTPVWYVGFSVPALLKTKSDLQSANKSNGLGANNHYFLTGGCTIESGQYMKFKPSALIKMVKGAPLQFDLSMMWWYNDVFGVGVSYRYKDAVVGLMELQLTKSLRLGYSYDYTTSDFRQYSSGSHEVMLRLTIPNAKKEEKVIIEKK